MSILMGPNCSLLRRSMTTVIGKNVFTASATATTTTQQQTKALSSLLLGNCNNFDTITSVNDSSNNNNNNYNNLAVQNRSMTILSKSSKDEYEKKNYSARMKASGKPVSPHVTIYSFPITALSSITNRVTGCMLSFGCFGLAGIELIGGTGSCYQLMDYIGSTQSILITFPIKFAIAFPVSYHYFAAIRHFAWDYKPELLASSAHVTSTSYQLFGSATVISTIIAIL